MLFETVIQILYLLYVLHQNGCWVLMSRPRFYPPKMFACLRELIPIVSQCVSYPIPAEPILHHVKRTKHIWTGSGASFAAAHQNIWGWIPGWHNDTDQHTSWCNWPFWFEQVLFTRNIQLLPFLQDWIFRWGKVLNVVGLSWFPPGCTLPAHTDSTGILNGSLSCHVALQTSNTKLCGLQVGADTVYHRQGQMLVFDSSLVHSAWNHSSKDRVLLYIDFKVLF